MLTGGGAAGGRLCSKGGDLLRSLNQIVLQSFQSLLPVKVGSEEKGGASWGGLGSDFLSPFS